MTHVHVPTTQCAATFQLNGAKQVLHLQRNEISRNWAELKSCTALRELDVSRNRLQWAVGSRDFDEALTVLASLKRLRELRLAHNPVNAKHMPDTNLHSSQRITSQLNTSPIRLAKQFHPPGPSRNVSGGFFSR